MSGRSEQPPLRDRVRRRPEDHLAHQARRVRRILPGARWIGRRICARGGRKPTATKENDVRHRPGRVAGVFKVAWNSTLIAGYDELSTFPSSCLGRPASPFVPFAVLTTVHATFGAFFGVRP